MLATISRPVVAPFLAETQLGRAPPWYTSSNAVDAADLVRAVGSTEPCACSPTPTTWTSRRTIRGRRCAPAPATSRSRRSTAGRRRPEMHDVLDLREMVADEIVERRQSGYVVEGLAPSPAVIAAASEDALRERLAALES